MKNQLYNQIVKYLVKNCKIEFAIAIISIIGVVLYYLLVMSKKEPSIDIEKALIIYVTDNRISLVTSVMAIFIGIYTTILTVIATSKTSIGELLLKSKMEGQILAVIGMGMLLDFILIIVGVFIPVKQWVFLSGYLSLLCIAMVSFVKFIFMVYKIFRINLSGMVREIDLEAQDRTDLIVKLDEILFRIRK